MGVLNIRKSVREGSRVVIGIAGYTGSGKTYTALKIARGMVDNSLEIGFLDTENKRGSLYADILDGEFLIGDLYPPFSPKRYIEAIKEFQDAGVKVLVVDSVSHEWEGDGGCHDISWRKDRQGNLYQDWAVAKREHKKFINALLQCNMHVIVCIRANDKVDMTDKKNIIKLGMQPICEKNFMFEMTASLMLSGSGKCQDFMKIPADLINVFGNGKNYLNESTGRGLIDWVNGGAKVDEELELWKSTLQMSTSTGLKSLDDACLKLPEHIKPKIRPFYLQFKASAVAVDEMNNAQIENSANDTPAVPSVTQKGNFVPQKITHAAPAEHSTTPIKENSTNKISQEVAGSDIDDF